jgi:hypothetical protein
MSFTRIRLMVLVMIVAVLAAACGGGAASPTSAPAGDPTASGESTGGGTTGGGDSAGDPAAAVEGFYAALYGGEGNIADFVCATTPEFADALQQAADASSAAMAEATISIEGLTYTVSDETADSATVTVEGNIVYTMAGTDTPVPYGPIPHNVVNEDGAWKVCG